MIITCCPVYQYKLSCEHIDNTPFPQNFPNVAQVVREPKDTGKHFWVLMQPESYKDIHLTWLIAQSFPIPILEPMCSGVWAVQDAWGMSKTLARVLELGWGAQIGHFTNIYARLSGQLGASPAEHSFQCLSFSLPFFHSFFLYESLSHTHRHSYSLILKFDPIWMFRQCSFFYV